MSPRWRCPLLLVVFLLSRPASFADTPSVAQVSRLTDLHGDPLPKGAIARLGTVRSRHNNRIASLDNSPDGLRFLPDRRILVVWDWRDPSFWDPLTGREHKFRRTLPPHSWCRAISPSGELITNNEGCQGRGWDFRTHVRVVALCAAQVVVSDKVP